MIFFIFIFFIFLFIDFNDYITGYNKSALINQGNQSNFKKI